MGSNDWGVSDETFCGGTPDDKSGCSHDRLPWLERELQPLLESPVTNGPTFSVEVYCGEPVFEDDEPPFGWVEVASGVPQWSLRRVLRHLYGCGWDTESVSVERED